MVLRRSWAKRGVQRRTSSDERNSQHPTFNVQSNSNLQHAWPGFCSGLTFGVFCGLSGGWMLDAGIFILIARSPRPPDSHSASIHKSDTPSLFLKMNRENSTSPTHPHFQAPASMPPASQGTAHSEPKLFLAETPLFHPHIDPSM